MSSDGQIVVVRLSKGTLAALRSIIGFFGTNPVRALSTFLVSFIVSLFLGLGQMLVKFVAAPFAFINNLIVWFGAFVASLIGPIGGIPLDVLQGVLEAVGDLAARAGVAGPIIAVGVSMLVIYVGYRLLVSYADNIPILGGTLRFLGLEP